MTSYLNLLKEASIFSVRRELAYFSSFSVSLIVSLMMIISHIIFLTVLTDAGQDIAGFSKDEMLFIFFMMQSTFYIYEALGRDLPRLVSVGVNSGVLDFAIIRPRSTLFVLLSEAIAPLRIIRNAPIMMVMAIAIDWSQLSFEWHHALFGMMIVILGRVVEFMMHLCLSCVAFWTGDSERLVIMSYSVNSQVVPFNVASNLIRFLAFYVLPVMLSGGLGAVVMLGDVSVVTGMTVLTIIGAIFATVSRLAWRAGLRAYTSASS